MSFRRSLAVQACCAAVVAVASAQSETPLLFEHVNLVRMQDGTVIRDATLAIAAGRVVAAGDVLGRARRIDAQGSFAIPGLWDMHVHVNEDTSWMLPLAAAAGVVGMRDMGGDIDAIPELRRLSDGIGMPRILVSGPILTGQVDDEDARVWRLREPTAVAAVFERLSGPAGRDASARVDHVKVHDWLTPETWQRIVHEARTRRLPIVGHVPVRLDAKQAAGRHHSIEHLGNAWGGLLLDVSAREADFKRAVRAHMLKARGPQELSAFFTPARWLDIAASYSPSKADSLARTLAHAGTFVCPTLYTFAFLTSRDAGVREKMDPRLAYLPAERRAMLTAMIGSATVDAAAAKSRDAVFRARQRLVRALHDGGVTLLAGTDYAQYPLVFPGFTLHDELAQLVDAGLSPLEALRAATANVGSYLGDNSVGCLDPGCRADAVFLAANPLEDIRRVGDVRAVLIRGHYLDPAARQKQLDDIRTRHASGVNASRRSTLGSLGYCGNEFLARTRRQGDH